MTQDETTHYLEGEGKDFMRECISLSLAACIRSGIDKLVIFTGTGDGPRYVAQEFLPQAEYQHLKIVAVTPPFGRPYRAIPGDQSSPLVRAGINPAMREDLWAMGIEVVAAHLPFNKVYTGNDYERASEWSRVVEAYGVLGGGFALCIQAVMLACDAGTVETGERVVVTSADTAFVATACRTESFLSPTEGLLVEHIVCRPSRYLISKRKHILLERTRDNTPAPQLEPGQEIASSAAPALPESVEPRSEAAKESSEG